RAYFGERLERDAAALACMRLMSDFREAMWGVVQQAISELDFDFVEYANKHFERLRQTAAAPRFRAALHTLESDYWTDAPPVGAVAGISKPRSISASSSSEPCRIGPLNHFRAESTYQPPNRRNEAITGSGV